MKINDIKNDEDILVIGGSEWKTDEPDNDSQDNIKDRKWKTISIILATILVLGVCSFIGKHILYNSQFPKSRPDKEIIRLLDNTMEGTPGIKPSTTESMGVKLKIYALSGLKASFADTVPDYNDPSVYFITRSADYKIENDKRVMIGDFVQNGEILSKSRWRAGFMAVSHDGNAQIGISRSDILSKSRWRAGFMAVSHDGNAQIGISRSDRIRRHILKENGSFFRQMAIVAAGTRCDKQYILKGKVTRCAYARDEAGKLYFVETAYPETLYGFADALIEYGFIDAVYVTGGTQPDLFYRDSNGTAHGCYVDDKPHKLVVWTK